MIELIKKNAQTDNPIQSYNKAFDGISITELVIKIQNGDMEAKEELYCRLTKEIVEMSEHFASSYRGYQDDESEYFHAIFRGTENAIRAFDHEKGEFEHFWHRIIKREKIKVLRDASRKGKPGKINTFFIDGMEQECSDIILYDSLGSDEYNRRTQTYIEENADLCLDFIRHHYSKADETMIYLWMNSLTLDEIAKKLGIPKKRLLSRLYTIIDSLRDNFMEQNILEDDINKTMTQ